MEGERYGLQIYLGEELGAKRLQEWKERQNGGGERRSLPLRVEKEKQIDATKQELLEDVRYFVNK